MWERKIPNNHFRPVELLEIAAIAAVAVFHFKTTNYYSKDYQFDKEKDWKCHKVSRGANGW